MILSLSRRIPALLTTSALVLTLSGTITVAQDQGGSGLALEEIVVTAERRAQNLQKVPLSITALTGEELDASGIETSLDLQYRTPGFVFKTNSILGQPYIRGVGSDLITAGAEPAVATFVDGVYQSRAYLALQDLYDVERIEVVKGPQGTLYGRNATAGAINIISKAPSPDFEAQTDVVYGNFNKVRVRGLINVPVVADRAFLRVSGLFSNRDGFTNNIFLKKRIDDEDFGAFRGQFRGIVSDNLEITLSGDYSKENSSRNAAPHPDPNNGINLALGPPFFGTIPTDPRQVTHDFLNFQNLKAWGLSAKVEWDLGLVTVTSISAYREANFSLGLDLDSTEVPLVTNTPVGETKTFTEELQVASNTEGDLQWVGGLFFLTEDAFQELNVGFPLFGSLSSPLGVLDSKALAFFGQAYYDLGEQIRLTAGVRYSHEERDERFSQVFQDDFGILTGVPGGFVIPAFDHGRKWNVWTPKFGVEYNPNDDVMVYASATRGFKAGGFNNDGTDAFNPEFIWAYEVGMKSTMADGRVRLNGAAFYYNYTDIQLQTIPVGAPVGTFPIVINVPKARVLGVEADLQAVLAEGLEVSLGAVFLDAEFRKFVALDPNNPQLGEVDRKGAQMPQAPDFTLTFATQYTWTMDNLGDFTLRGEYRYQSSIFFNTFQDPVVSQSGYSLFNARLSFESSTGNWYAAIFGKNLTDKLYAQTKIRQDPLIGNLRFWGPPRTYGGQLGYRF